jgi:hypothetical protein
MFTLRPAVCGEYVYRRCRSRTRHVSEKLTSLAHATGSWCPINAAEELLWVIFIRPVVARRFFGLLPVDTEYVYS